MRLINFFYLFLKIIKKNIKVNFKKIEKKKIIIFDGQSIKDLVYVIKKYDYYILECRYERFTEFNFSLTTIINFIKYFYLLKNKNFSLTTIYYLSIIKQVNPSLVITSIDNSLLFWKLARFFEHETKFIAIQNAVRNDFYNNEYYFVNKIKKKNLNSEVFIPYYFCFGDEEERLAKKFNLNIKNFFKYGSIRTANFFEYLNENKLNLKKHLFDICLISEPSWGMNLMFKKAGIEEAYGKVAKFTIKFSEENNKKLIFANRKIKDSKAYFAELNFYKKHLSPHEFKYLIKSSYEKTNIYSSYFAIFQSTVAIAGTSTLLRDKLGMKEKILSCNLTNFSSYNFPINGICSLNNCNYDEFSKRLKLILDIKESEYFNNLDIKRIMNFDIKKNLLNEIKLEIDKSIK